MTKKTELTMRERVAMRLIMLAIKIICPVDYEYKLKDLLKGIEDEL